LQPLVQSSSLAVSVIILELFKSIARTVAAKFPFSVATVIFDNPVPGGPETVGDEVGFGVGTRVGFGVGVDDGAGVTVGSGVGLGSGLGVGARMSMEGALICFD
jgi:hypothetical protein